MHTVCSFPFRTLLPHIPCSGNHILHNYQVDPFRLRSSSWRHCCCRRCSTMTSPQDGSNDPLAYDIRNSNLHGRGLFASRDIAAGEDVLSDVFIWVIPKHDALKCYPLNRNGPKSSDILIKSMLHFIDIIGEQYGARRRREYLTETLTLHNGFSSWNEAKALWEIGPKEFVKKVSDIFIANAIPKTMNGPAMEESDFAAVFITAAKINHSCAPNVQVFVRHTEGGPIVARAIAIRPIAENEEITRSYVNLLLPISTREKMLRLGWNFGCACELCARTPDQRAVSDERRAKLVVARTRIEALKETMEKSKPIGITEQSWKKREEEICDEILGEENIGVVVEAATKEDGLSGWYLFERYVCVCAHLGRQKECC